MMLKQLQTTDKYTAGFSTLVCQTPYAYSFDIAVWYPSLGVEQQVSYLPQFLGKVVPNGAICVGEFPLIMVSSGYGGNAYDQAYLAESLASNGFVVASVSHNKFEQRLASLGLERAWYRAKELQLGLDCILGSTFRQSISNSHDVGLIGFSAGGFSAFLLAGAIPDFKLDPSFFDVLKLYENVDFSTLQDSRIGSFVLLAPALGNVFTPSELKKIKQKVLLFLADKDEVLEDSADNYINFLPNITKINILENAGHFVFNGKIPPLMKKLYPKKCKDIAMPREIFHPTIIEKCNLFFDGIYLKNFKGIHIDG